MIVGSDGQRVFIEEERSALSPDCAPEPTEPTGQMFMIRRGIEALLAKGEPLPMLKPTQAWRRITSHLQGTGIHALEIPHQSTYNRFRKRYGSRYRLR